MLQEDLIQFEKEDFDLAEFVNKKFPNEDSLVNLDDEIKRIDEQLMILQESIRNQIKEQDSANKITWEEMKGVKEEIKEIIKEVKEIQTQAKQSEEMVEEMCKEIKVLDQAKTNITLSINCLSKFSDLSQTLEYIKTLASDRNFKELPQQVQCCYVLGEFFKPYEEVPQILELVQAKDKVINHLQTIIQDEFTLYYKNMSSMSKTQFVDACKLSEILGLKFKNKILEIGVNFIILQYWELFDSRPSMDLKSIEKWFIWFTKSVHEFKQKHLDLYPIYWGIICFIVNEFCCETSIHVVKVLQQTEVNESQIVNLMKAFQNAINFEKAMQKELNINFEQIQAAGKQNQFAISQVPKVIGSISNSFEEYTQLYVIKEEKELNEKVYWELQANLNDYQNTALGHEELNLFQSSIVLFKLIKLLIERVSNLSKGKTLTLIAETIKRSINGFVDQMTKFLNKEEQNIKKENEEENFLLKLILLVINTLDYIKESIDKIHESIMEIIQQPFDQQITLLQSETHVQMSIQECIGTLNRRYEIWVDALLAQGLTKISLENKPQQGPGYMEKLQSLISVYLSLFEHFSPKQFHLKIIITLSETFNDRFFENVLKLKKFQGNQVEIFIQEYQEGQKYLESLSVGSDLDSIYQSANKNLSKRNMAKLRLLGLSISEIKQEMDEIVSTIDWPEFRWILTTKGIKKTEIAQLFNEQQSKQG